MGSSNVLTYGVKYANNPVILQRKIYSDGELLGDDSAHNGLQAVRGTPDIYNEWAVISNNKKWK